MSNLLQSIESFRSGKFKKLESHYESLKASQSPHTLLVTCSDSRLCPQEMTQTQAGDLFVVRNAGNLIPEYSIDNPSNEGLTIEYGVLALGIEHIVVCGHVSCGAMGGLQSLDKLTALPMVHSGLQKYKNKYPDEIEQCEQLDSLISWNVRKQLQHLWGHPFINERVANGKLQVHGMVYDFVQATTGDICHLSAQGQVVDGSTNS